MEAYKIWVRRNRDYVHSLESLASGLTWLLPERFSDSEIGPEAVTSILGIITAINEHILEATPIQAQTGHAESSSFPFSLCITLLKDLETLVEVVAQQFYGEDKKWNFMAVTEAVKVLLRLAILQRSGYKMLLHGGETVNDSSESHDLENRRNLPLSRPSHQGAYGIPKSHGQTPWNLEGRALSALNSFGENVRTVSEPSWLRRVQHQQSIIEPPKPVAEKPSLLTYLSEKGIPGGLFLTGEVMFILRPLIYVLLIRKYGARSWFPWLTSLAVDLAGNGIISFLTMAWQNSKDFHLSNMENNELSVSVHIAAKKAKIAVGALPHERPFFTKYTRQKLDGTPKLLEPVPIVGLLTEKLVELVVGAQTRYTYMSGS